jgi:DNA-directed RNA polymerase specialized sigma24 family protein
MRSEGMTDGENHRDLLTRLSTALAMTEATYLEARRRRDLYSPVAPPSAWLASPEYATLRARLENAHASAEAALAGIFGMGPAYLLDREKPVFDGTLVEALQDETVQEVACEISRLSERDRRLMLGIVRQFGSR